MENKVIKILRSVFAVLICAFVAISVIVPVIKVSIDDVTTKFYLPMFVGGSVNVLSGAVSTMTLWSLVAVMFFIVCPLGVLTNNKIVRAIAFAGAVVVLVFAFSVNDSVKLVRESILTSETTIKLSTLGNKLFKLSSIASVIFVAVDNVIYFFGPGIVHFFKYGTKGK